MSKPVLDPAFWWERLKAHPNERHKAVYVCPAELWRSIEDTHRKILARSVNWHDSVLEVGCGYGRAIDLLPPHLHYTGIDLSPEFIALAKTEYPPNDARRFVCGRAEDVLATLPDGKFDFGFCISVRGMLLREVGPQAWEPIRTQLLRVCRRFLVLEYEPDNHVGEVLT